MASLKKISYKNLTPAELDEIAARARYVSNDAEKAAVGGEQPGGLPPSADAPPQLTGGERVDDEDSVKIVLTDSGKVKIIPKRRGWGGKTAFVDWLNFTFHESSITRFAGPMVSDEEFILAYSEKIEKILGYGITSVNPTGRHFYQKSYVLGDGYGLVCYGGQRNTLLTSISGEGLAAAKPGWEKRLHDFLKDVAILPRITRVDVAHDDYEGQEYSVDRADAEFDQGLFSCGGRTPDCEKRGNWKRPNGKGRTFYVGHRVNGKYARIYEKGKQLGDRESLWCRIEVEFKSVDRVIPLDILFNPGEYLAAAYPAFGWISQEQQIIRTVQKATEISYESMCDWLIRQCGSALAVVAEIEGGVSQAFAKVGKFKKIPNRLRIPSHENAPMPLHKKFIESIKLREFEIAHLIAPEPEFILTEPCFE